jgi:AmmeMemoRadiSam system protein A
VDEAVAKAILDHDSLIKDIESAHAREHSLELQLPFVIEAIGEVPIVPIAMGGQDIENVKRVAGAIASALKGKRGLIIASSDLSHFHDGDTADRIDNKLIEKVKEMEPAAFVSDLQSGVIEACGGGPVAAMLMASKELGATGISILNYRNSGDVTGDRSSVVGYLAAAVFKANGERTKGSAVGEETQLISTEDQEYLLEVVKETIRAKLEGEKPSYEKSDSKVLGERWGAFVTLKIADRLRGCIGQLIPSGELLEVIKGMAIAAAFEDPRFTPLTKEEFEHVEIEISVLSPLQKIDDPAKVEVGKHGIYMRKGIRTGVLLPQVAVEQGWNRDQFLRATCRKAGLPAGCWEESETEIYIFSGQVF